MRRKGLGRAGGEAAGRGRRYGVLLLLVVLLPAVAACQGKAEKVQKLLQSGKGFFDRGQYNEALIQFKNVIQQDPESSEGHYELGRCYLQLKNPVEAFRAFQRAVELDPAYRDAQRQLGNLSLLFGDLETAQAMAEALKQQDEWAWEGDVLVARVAMLQKQDDEALEALDRAVKRAPQEVLPRILQGRLLERQGELDKAGKLYERLWEQFPESFEVERVLYQYHAAQGRPERVSALAERNLPRETNRLQRLRFLAALYLQMGNAHEASTLCAQAIEERPEDPDLRMLAGKISLAEGNVKEAEAQWKKGLDLDPQDMRTRTALAEMYLRQNRLQEVDGLMKPTLDRDPGNLQALLMMGRVRLLEKRYAEAQKFLQQALERSPDNVGARYFLGLCYANSGQRELAVQNLQAALDADPSMEKARKALAELHVRGGDLQLAEELLTPLIQEKKADKDTVILYSEILRREGRSDDAMSLLEIEEKSYPLDKAFPLQKGRVRMTAGDPEGAARFFRQALKLDPGAQEPVFRLAQILLQRQGPDEAGAWIESRLPDMQDKAPFYDLLGKIALSQGDTREAEQAWKKALEADPNLLDAYLSLASLYIRLKTREKALQIARDLEVQKPESPVGPMLQGMVLESMGKPREAMAAYEKVLALTPDFGPAANNLAYLTLEEGSDPQKALGLAEKARQQLPDHPAVADTLGWVYERMGLHDKALNLFLESAEQLPDQPTIQYHLGVAYQSLGKYDLARKCFGKALALSGAFPEADEARKRLEALGGH